MIESEMAEIIAEVDLRIDKALHRHNHECGIGFTISQMRIINDRIEDALAKLQSVTKVESEPEHYVGEPCNLPLSKYAKEIWPDGKFRFEFTCEKPKWDLLAGVPVIYEGRDCIDASTGTPPPSLNYHILRTTRLRPRKEQTMSELMDEFEKCKAQVEDGHSYWNSHRYTTGPWNQIRDILTRLENETKVFHRAIYNMAAKSCGAFSINSYRLADETIAQARAEIEAEKGTPDGK